MNTWSIYQECLSDFVFSSPGGDPLDVELIDSSDDGGDESLSAYERQFLQLNFKKKARPKSCP